MMMLKERCLLFWNKQDRPLRKAEIVRNAKNKTAIITMLSDPIDAEVIDLRTLLPLDSETILASVKKTNG